jgi:hypothetical protein
MTPPQIHLPRLTPGTRILMLALGGIYLANLALYVAGGFNGAGLYLNVVNWLVLGVSDLLSGRIWTVLTYFAVIIPSDFVGVLIELLVLYFFAPDVERARSRKFLLQLSALAIPAGAFGHLIMVATAGAFLPYLFEISAMGTTAIINAVVASMCWIHRDRMLSFFGIQMNGWGLLGIWLAFDVLTALTVSASEFGLQLGGVAAGLLFSGGFALWRRRLRLMYQRRRLKVVAGKDARDLMN